MAEYFDIDQDLELTIEMAFGSNPLATPTWTDITQYVRNFSTKRGRSGSFGSVQPGSVNLFLSNGDGRFDPRYVTGAYYPNVAPLVPIRITGNYNAAGAVSAPAVSGPAWSTTPAANRPLPSPLKSRIPGIR